MFTKAERLISLRNLKPKKKEGFLKIISIFSFLGIMLGVAILIIVMSVLILALFLLENNSEEKLYNPPKFDGEKVIPGFFDEKN